MRTVELGIQESHRQHAAELYWDAFGQMLGRAIGPRARAIALIAPRLELDRAMVVVDEGRLLGLAGFHLDGRALINLTLRNVFREFGPIRGLWRAPLLAMLAREPRPGELLLDGIVVDPGQRGRGIGTQLLHALVEHAHSQGLTSVRLDVVDTNPRAQALYKRHGFVVTKSERTPYLKKLMGFGSHSEMVASLGPYTQPGTR